MFDTMLNAKTVTLKIQRIDLCNLILACTALDTTTDCENTKWKNLHDKLESILKDFDKKQGY